jgi:Uma2 family endonuclease
MSRVSGKLLGMNLPHTLPRHKLSLAAYHQMAQAGILAEDSRVELIQGELIDMAPIGSRHAWMLNVLVKALIDAVGNSAIVSPQNPIALPPDSEPQPDLALLRPKATGYAEALPGAADVLLLIEIADTTVEYDRTIKLQLYAAHDIPEVWLFDLRRGVVEVNLEPTTKGYRRRLERKNSEILTPSLLPAVNVSLAEIWRKA